MESSVVPGYINKRWRKPKGQSSMDNPERHATLGIRHRTKTNKHQKHSTQNYKDEQHGPHQKQGGEHRGSQNTDPTKIRGVGVNTWDRKTRTPPKTGG